MTWLDRTLNSKPVRAGAIVLLVLVLLLGAIAVFWEQLPYQDATAYQLRRVLKEYGVTATRLEVERLTRGEAVIHDIQLGEKKPLAIGRLQATYTLEQARRGIFKTIEAEGITLHAYRHEKGWRIGGLESFTLPAAEKESPDFSLVDARALRRVLPQHTSLKQGKAIIEPQGGNISLPFAAEISAQDAISVSARSDGLSGKIGDYPLASGKASFRAAFDETKKEWDGKLQASSVTISGLPEEVPPLMVEGEVRLAENGLRSNMQMRDKSGQWSGEAVLSASLADFSKGEIMVSRLKLPWGGGTLSTASVRIPLRGGTSIRIPVAFREVDLMALIGRLSGGKVSGSGRVNGVLPVTYHPNGRLTLENGTAESTSGGRIAISPEVLAGQDSKQMEAVRTALQDFQYTTLRARLSSDAKDQAAIQLTLEGRNPAAFGGKPVKLNVNLTGDVLPLIEQSILPVRDPNRLLEKKN